ncbi:MAG: cytochrome c3 family protein [Phycisphaerae bacterium]
MRVIVAFVAAVLLAGGFAAIVYGVGGSPAVVQPIAFNHAVHTGEAGITCTECHTDAETRVSAGLPGKAGCFDCHDIDDEAGTHAEKDKLFAFDDIDGDIPWIRVAVTRPDVFFSHRRHVRSGGIECLRCHTGQTALTKPPTRVQLVMSMTMCIDCHNERGVSTDCLACHR